MGRPTRKQFAAIDETWGLTLRKGGQFFLTGYRAGSARRCAADADGWKLYATSVIACARDRGWSRQRIQDAYYGPRIDYVWSSGPPGPQVSTPQVTLKHKASLHAAFATVSWRDTTSGSKTPRISRYRLQHRVGDRRWRDVPLTRRKSTSAHLDLKLEQGHEFRVRAKDRERRPWVMVVERSIEGSAPRRERQQRLRDARCASSTSAVVARAYPLHRPVRRARRDARPKMGRAEVTVNGRVVARVDLERRTRSDQKLVWTRNWSRERVRRVVVRPVGEDDHVQVDGFLVLR